MYMKKKRGIKMKIKELKKELENLDENLDVVVFIDNYGSTGILSNDVRIGVFDDETKDFTDCDCYHEPPKPNAILLS